VDEIDRKNIFREEVRKFRDGCQDSQAYIDFIFKVGRLIFRQGISGLTVQEILREEIDGGIPGERGEES